MARKMERLEAAATIVAGSGETRDAGMKRATAGQGRTAGTVPLQGPRVHVGMFAPSATHTNCTSSPSDVPVVFERMFSNTAGTSYFCVIEYGQKTMRKCQEPGVHAGTYCEPGHISHLRVV